MFNKTTFSRPSCKNKSVYGMPREVSWELQLLIDTWQGEVFLNQDFGKIGTEKLKFKLKTET